VGAGNIVELDTILVEVVEHGHAVFIANAIVRLSSTLTAKAKSSLKI
jgi:hypothetical protein